MVSLFNDIPKKGFEGRSKVNAFVRFFVYLRVLIILNYPEVIS
jgi:hypothetical protein